MSQSRIICEYIWHKGKHTVYFKEMYKFLYIILRNLSAV